MSGNSPVHSSVRLRSKRHQGLIGIAAVGATGLTNNLTQNLQQDLIKYYQGEKISFANILLDLINTKDFPKNVLTICRSIPYGEVRTYKWIAKTMGNPKLARPIGNVLSTNNHPIVIPCHRVIRSDGNIGGFAGKIHPKSLKHYLLKLEGNNL